MVDLSQLSQVMPLLITICLLGLVVTFIWLYIQDWYKRMIDAVSGLVSECVPGYKLAMRRVKEKGGWLHHVKILPSPLWFIAYLLPGLLIVAWIVFLCWTIAVPN